MEEEVSLSMDSSGRVTVAFRYNPEFVIKVKSIPQHKWHPEEKYWSFPNSNGTLKKILEVFEGEKIHLAPALQDKLPAPVIARPEGLKQSQTDKGHNFEDLRRELLTRKYSLMTVKGYLYYNRDFLGFIDKSPSEITDSNIKDYLLYPALFKSARIYLAEEKESATATLNQAINALKFYYGTILKKKFIYEIKRPRKDKLLPDVLSREEVSRIIKLTDNIKHKALLMIIYSGGLRLGEAARLELAHLDRDRMLILVKGAKGRKDRYTLLSEKALELIDRYIQKYEPKKWLFEGAKAGRYLSRRSIEKVFEQARDRAGVIKDVSVHDLRHSFATHLLEGGTDLRYTPHFMEHYHNSATI